MRKNNPHLRMCIACRKMYPKEELLRFYRTKDTNVSIDASQTQGGRGAYLCKQEACKKTVQQRHSLEKVFKCKMNQEIWLYLEAFSPPSA